MKCKGGCGIEIPEAGLCLREQDGGIIIDLWPEKGDDGPWCGDCSEKEARRRVDELDAAQAASDVLKDVKQVIIIRRDLKMRRGKEIAQGAHAAMAWLSKRVRATIRECDAWIDLSPAEEKWIDGSFKKVTCRVNSQEELLAVAQRAREAGLQVELMVDSGATEFHGVPTLTCIAIGPDWEDRFAGVTDELELY